MSARGVAWLGVCAAVVAAGARPLHAAQPQPWAPYSFDAPWSGGARGLPGGGSGGGTALRSVEFAEATCRQTSAALPLSFALPAAFVVHAPAAGAVRGDCLWATHADLERVLRDAGAKVAGLQDGLFRARLAPDLRYDPSARRFTADDGAPLLTWRHHARWAGYTNLHVIEEQRAGVPALRVVADGPAERVYLLYLAFPAGRDVLLIRYHPSTRGPAADDATWARFVEGIQRTTTAAPAT